MSNSFVIQNYINEVKDTIEKAQEDLLSIKIIREYDPTEYSHTMQQLDQLELNVQSLFKNATPQEQKMLNEAREQIRYTKEVMVRGI